MSDFFDDLDERLDEQATAAEDAFDSETWDPKEGDTLRGILVRADVVTVSFGPAIIINVKTLNDEGTYAVWCSRSVLKRAIVDQMPALGRGIAIRFEGMQSTKDGSNEFGMYTVLSEASDPAFWHELFARKPLDGPSKRTDDGTNEPRPGSGNFFGT